MDVHPEIKDYLDKVAGKVHSNGGSVMKSLEHILDMYEELRYQSSARPSWDDTFMEIAKIVSQRATCSRRKVGAVLVQDNRIISTGYNGVRPKALHCTDGGCPRGKFTHDELPKDADYNVWPCLAVHAEANALLRAGHAAAKGGTLYVTTEPCQQCWNLIQAAEIERVVIDGARNAGEAG